MSGDESGVVRVWDLTADKCSLELKPRDRPDAPAIRSVAVAGDASCLVAATHDANVYCWRPDNNGGYALEHIIEAAHDDGSDHT